MSVGRSHDSARTAESHASKDAKLTDLPPGITWSIIETAFKRFLTDAGSLPEGFIFDPKKARHFKGLYLQRLAAEVPIETSFYSAMFHGRYQRDIARLLQEREGGGISLSDDPKTAPIARLYFAFYYSDPALVDARVTAVDDADEDEADVAAGAGGALLAESDAEAEAEPKAEAEPETEDEIEDKVEHGADAGAGAGAGMGTEAEAMADVDADAGAGSGPADAADDAEAVEGGAAAAATASAAAAHAEAAALAEAAVWFRRRARVRVRDLDRGGCFYLLRRFRLAIQSDLNLMHGLNPAWWAPRKEEKAFAVIPVGSIGGKAHDRPWFKASNKSSVLEVPEGGEYAGAAAADAPARLISFRL